MNKELQIQEAIKRMKLLKLHENPIKEFEKDGTINQSEYGGMLYWLNESEKERVKTFEKKHNALVYHVIHTYSDIGEMFALLFVSDSEEEWEYDIDDLKAGYPFAYVMNLDDDDCSEFGSIGVKPQFGGLVRTA